MNPLARMDAKEFRTFTTVGCGPSNTQRYWSVAALTVYDMCKAVQKDMQITDVRLENKTGGKSDFEREVA